MRRAIDLMSFNIWRGLAWGRLRDVLPPQYAGLATHVSDAEAKCTVLVFGNGSHDVVRSRVAAKALRELGEVEGKVFAVSGGFTQEAETLLREANIEILSRSSTWTDASYERIRVSVGARVKRPPRRAAALRYVGPPEILHRSLATPSPTRRLIECPQDVADWARQTQQHLDSGREVTATFVVDTGERLWIADRCSEHVACAQSPQVLAAGEMTFYVEEEWAEVVGTSNQSTGFCPPPASWRDVEAALNAARLKHPGGWTSEFEFRRCDTCGTTNIVKDSWFWCEACGAQLSAEWNYG